MLESGLLKDVAINTMDSYARCAYIVRHLSLRTSLHTNAYSLVTSPITSYADQVYSIYRNRSSAGFSLDIPLIMLVSSILKYGTLSND